MKTQILSAVLIVSQQCNLSAASLLRGKDGAEHNNRKLDTRIINGSEASEDRYSYAVSLQDHISHFCGGSLIAKDVILTAAHCQGGTYNVVLGRHDWNDNDGEVIAMKKELPHPNYDAQSTNNDFMLVFLNSATTANNVDLVTLNSASSVPSVGQGVTVMGWGDIDIRNDVSELSDALMSVNVNVISDQECDNSEGTIDGYSDNYNGKITKNMLCARANQQDSCQGDSGGPLVIKGVNAGADVQVGVVSWGIGCASEHFPGVYARVSQAYGWIESEVCQGSSYASEAGFDCSSVTVSTDNDSGGSPNEDNITEDNITEEYIHGLLGGSSRA